MKGRATPGQALRAQLKVCLAILRAAQGQPARLLDRLALLCGQGRIEPYEPRGAGLVEFSDAFP